MARGITILRVVAAAMAAGFVMGRFTAPGLRADRSNRDESP